MWILAARRVRYAAPIRTTTSTTTTTTLVDARRRFYEVKPGDNLAEIARSFEVPRSEIVRINRLPNDGEIIQIGQVLEIPTDVVLIDSLPTPQDDRDSPDRYRSRRPMNRRPCVCRQPSCSYTRGMSFWPNQDHWSVKIPLTTDHYRMAVLADTGVVELNPMATDVPASEWESLEYMDWKSGGDTNFAPIASADGELDCRGFWDKGKTDKDALWTSNAVIAPTLREYVDGVGANFGRVRIIKLEPQDREQAIKSLHRDDNNRFNPDGEGWVVRSWVELTDNPDSYMLLMDNGADGLPDPATERRVPLPRGSRFVVDTQRLWHVVVHNGDAPRYALITSFESGPALETWIDSERAPVSV